MPSRTKDPGQGDCLFDRFSIQRVDGRPDRTGADLQRPLGRHGLQHPVVGQEEVGQLLVHVGAEDDHFAGLAQPFDGGNRAMGPFLVGRAYDIHFGVGGQDAAHDPVRGGRVPGVPGGDELDAGRLFELALPAQIVFYLTAGFVTIVVVSLLTRRAPKQKLDPFYGCLRTPVGPDEPQTAPFTLPPGVEPAPRRVWCDFLELEIPKISKIGLIGVTVTAAAVAAFIAGVFWIFSLAT